MKPRVVNQDTCKNFVFKLFLKYLLKKFSNSYTANRSEEMFLNTEA